MVTPVAGRDPLDGPRGPIDPHYRGQPPEVDPRGIVYPSPHTPREQYLTTVQLARMLNPPQYPETVFRWCVRWFGKLPPGRTNATQGYRIPVEYLRVARGYLQTQDVNLRKILRKALVREPRDWIVIYGNVASTHNSQAETWVRLQSLAEHVTLTREPIHVFYVGDRT